MNVTCPQCATVFRVDPAKVPERGVRARCSVCAGLIAVHRPAVGASPAASAPAPSVTAPAPESPRPVLPVPTPPPAEVPPAPAPVRMPEPEPEPEPTPELEAEAVEVEVEPPTPVAPPPIAPLPPPPTPTGAAPRSPAASRFSNPFLQQDPSARARRLARALISDLVVYHPEKRQRGLAEGNLKELFGEEIRKSWEEYAGQVGEDVANTTPYFTEALNEILAEGRKLFG